MTLGTEIPAIFQALFGDGNGIRLVDGKWTFTPATGLPKLPGEGILTYLARLSENCLIIRGAWAPGEYLKNQCVAHDNMMWVAIEATSETPGNPPWVPLFNSLTGLKGDPGRDGFSATLEVH